MLGLARQLARVLCSVLGTLKWLAIPISVLLFLQWPLREVFKGYAREANDLGQWLFALYVAASVTAATRAGTHLATDALARHLRVRTRRILGQLANVLALLPWAVFVMVSATPMIVTSVAQLERFPDTGNPGYFLIKLSLWLLSAAMLAGIVLDAVFPDRTTTRDADER